MDSALFGRAGPPPQAAQQRHPSPLKGRRSRRVVKNETSSLSPDCRRPPIEQRRVSDGELKHAFGESPLICPSEEEVAELELLAMKQLSVTEMLKVMAGGEIAQSSQAPAQPAAVAPVVDGFKDGESSVA